MKDFYVGERYYRAMLKETGKTIFMGKVVHKNNKPPKYTDEFKEEIKRKYLESDPTANNTVELCKSLADEHGVSANVIRQLLVNAEVYISQGQITASKKSTSTKLDKSKMQDSIQTVIEGLGEKADLDIISKLTGKAANYLSSVMSKLTNLEVKNTFTEKLGKAESIALLDKLIFEIEEGSVDNAITSKLTGKAALYFANVIERNTKND